MKQLLLAVGLSGALLPAAPATDVFNVTSNETSTTTFGDYVGGDARTAIVNVSGTGTVWTMDSVWSNGFSGSKSTWNITDGATILVTSNAWINNNMADLINARPFGVVGTNTGEVIEFAEDFNADLGSAAQPVGGLSTLNLANATMITHHTRNLPSIWKYIPGPLLSHHGLIVFSTGPNPRWNVRTNSQQYQGGVYWKYDWTLDVADGLTLEMADTASERAIGADVGFGPYTGTTGTTLTKLGAGTLALNGDTGWQSNSTVAVVEGAVVVRNHDPAAQFAAGYMNRSGQCLTLDISVGAAAAILQNEATDEWGIETVHNAGQFTVGEGALDLAGDWLAETTSTNVLTLSVADKLRTKVTVAGTLRQAGVLAILGPGTLALGEYDLFDASEFAGSFTLALPDGYAGLYDSSTGVLTLTIIPEPSSALLVLAGLALLLAGRRRH